MITPPDAPLIEKKMTCGEFASGKTLVTFAVRSMVELAISAFTTVELVTVCVLPAK